MRLSHSVTLGFLGDWNGPTLEPIYTQWARKSPFSHGKPDGNTVQKSSFFPRSRLDVSSKKHHEPINSPLNLCSSTKALQSFNHTKTS